VFQEVHRRVSKMNKKAVSSNAVGLATMASSIEYIDNYNHWMLEKLRPYLGTSLLEVGTGQGNFRKYFPTVNFYVSIDIDAKVIQRARDRYPNDVFIVADIAEKEFVQKLADHGIDTILCANVIEHIREDTKAIAHLLSVLRIDGYLFLFVPALPLLYNDMDRLAGHYRRYTKEMLANTVGAKGQIVLLEYFNPIGGIGWWVNKFFKHKDLDSKNINWQVMFFENYVVPVSKMLNPCTKGFFGQSLICVIRKKG